MRDTRARAKAGARIIASGWCRPNSNVGAGSSGIVWSMASSTAEFADGLHALALVAKAPGEA